MIDIALSKKQGNFRVNAAFTASETGTTALFGPSGAGKTSLIQMIAGLSRPDSGHITINGTTVFDSQKGIDLPPEKRRFGYVFQEGRLFPHLSVRSNLVYGMKRIPAKERFIELGQVVNLLGIGHLMDRRPATLSGGEKQRVAIGRALLTSPLLLLMDEPLASLDATRKTEVLPFISRLSDQLSIPIVYVSHALDEIINLADTLVFLSNGKTKAFGPVEEMVVRNDFRELSGLSDPGTILKTRVTSHNPASQLTRLTFKGGELAIPLTNLTVGDELRAWIRSREVGLSIERIPKSSFQNIFKGTITDICLHPDNTLADVRVDIGVPITATVTGHAAKNLGLHPGMEIHTLVKSVSISF